MITSRDLFDLPPSPGGRSGALVDYGGEIFGVPACYLEGDCRGFGGTMISDHRARYHRSGGLAQFWQGQRTELPLFPACPEQRPGTEPLTD